MIAALAATLAAPEVRAASACLCGFTNGRFTLATMTIDGASSGATGPLTGWDTIKADTDNNICDAASAGSPTELGGVDGIADAPQALGRDLTWFAFTWDATNVYFFTERAGGTSSVQRFIYYGDLNNDGIMSTGERAIQVEWNGSNRLVKIYRATYNAVNVGGDGLADSSGVADGYVMPGTLTQIDALNSSLRQGNWGSTDGSQMEFAVAWTEFGLSGPTAIRFHVSSMNANFNGSNPPGPGIVPGNSSIEDNMAGCGGGTGSTQFADGSVTSTTSSISHTLNNYTCAAVTVTNLGNASDTFELSNDAASVFYDDGTVHPTTTYYLDVNGNGTYESGTDTALTNTGGASTVDTGSVSPLATKKLLVCSSNATNPNVYTPNGDAVVTTTFTSTFNTSVTFTHVQTVAVTLLPNPSVTKTSTAISDPSNGATNPKRIPGSYVDYTIAVSNAGGGTINNNTTVITDPIPTGLALYVSNIGGSPTGPVSQTAGSPSCGLSLTFTALNNTLDGIDFSNDNGVTWTYSPTADANGVDTAVTNVRIKPTGTFAATTASGTPSCSWKFRMRVK